MKRIVLVLCSVFYHFILIAQLPPSYQLTIGKEIRAEKKVPDLWIVTADNNNIYYAEKWVDKHGNFPIGKDITYGGHLVKADNNFNTIYKKEYGEKELNGHSFSGFRLLGDDLFIIAEEYTRKGSFHQYYIARIDKSTGELLTELVEAEKIRTKELLSISYMKTVSVEEDSAFFTINRLPDEERLSFGIHYIDKNLKKTQSSEIDLSFAPGYYVMKDLQYLKEKIVILGKEYKDDPANTKNKKRVIYKNHVITLYNTVTNKAKNVVFQPGNKILGEPRLLRQPNGDIFLAGFYANTADWVTMNGFFIYKIDTETGTATLVSSKDIDESTLAKGFVDEDDVKKYSKKTDKLLEEHVENKFGHFVIKSVEINPADNSFILITELSRHYAVSSTINNSNERVARFVDKYDHRFILRDILITKIDKQGNIVWMNDLPKIHIESVTSGNPAVNGSLHFSYGALSYFTPYGDMPSFSSFKSMIFNDKLIILMNDHKANTTNGRPGEPVRAVFNFQENSALYGITLDLTTGNIDRKFIYENIDRLTMLPRNALVIGNAFYILISNYHLFGKPEYQIAKVAVE